MSADPRVMPTPRRSVMSERDGSSGSVRCPGGLCDDAAFHREGVQRVLMDFFVDLLGDYDLFILRTRVVPLRTKHHHRYSCVGCAYAYVV